MRPFPERPNRWFLRPPLWLEVFVLLNLGFLAPDILLAHATNSFRKWPEYIPLYFSAVAPILLLIGIACREVLSWTLPGRFLGFLVGWAAVVIGVAGLVWHLESQFFQEWTVDSLVYTAPFAAPLAYTGIGLLLLMNLMVDPATEAWPRWVLLLALGGFIGNFVFSLADHAQNGFFHWTEWIPVVSSAFAVGFLLAPFFLPVSRSYLPWCVGVMLVQALVGLLGFALHTNANLHGPAPGTFDNFVYGAPPLAPLLFPNLVVLTFIGLWVWRGHLPSGPQGPEVPPLVPGPPSA